MNEFLKNLEIGESKIKLSDTEIKSILAKHGEVVKTETKKVEDNLQTQINDSKSTIEDLKKQIESSPNPQEMESLKNKIADYEKAEAERVEAQKAKAKDDQLMANINEAIKDKKFINEYTKNAIVNEVKAQLLDESNVGKSATDLFNQITKDKMDIFENPNQIGKMTGMGDVSNVESNKSSSAEIKFNPLLRQ